MTRLNICIALAALLAVGCGESTGGSQNNNANANGNANNTNGNANNNNQPPPGCGNGVVDPGEACDDGNNDDGDDCRGDCGQDFTLCGNSAVDQGEGCDDGAANSDAPNATCRTNCQPAACGDNILDDQAGEQCDDGPVNADLPNACRTTCLLPSCGDLIIDDALGEACDDGANNSDMTPDACRLSCQLAGCGDDVIDAGEACDGADLGGQDCTNFGFTAGVLVCDGVCAYDQSGCNNCGDGTCDPGEVGACFLDCGTLKVSAGWSSSCAVMMDGTGQCWGINSDGQLGDGTFVNHDVPMPVTGLVDAIDIDVSVWHACALQSAGTVMCWGRGNAGQLGDGTFLQRLTANPVSGLNDAILVQGGAHHTCAIRSGGQVACWGNNSRGQLGNGNNTDSGVPVSAGVSDAIDISLGEFTTCAVRQSGAVECWGGNTFGNLGNGTLVDANTPQAVPGITNAVKVTTRYNHTCVVLADGTARCWGQGNVGQLGQGFESPFEANPVSVVGLTNAVDIEGGVQYSCALLDTGEVSCWGRNIFGVHGNGTFTRTAQPTTPVTGLANVVDLGSGDEHQCLALADGTVRCMGSDSFGQLGTASGGTSNVPVQPVGL